MKKIVMLLALLFLGYNLIYGQHAPVTSVVFEGGNYKPSGNSAPGFPQLDFSAACKVTVYSDRPIISARWRLELPSTHTIDDVGLLNSDGSTSFNFVTSPQIGFYRLSVDFTTIDGSRHFGVEEWIIHVPNPSEGGGGGRLPDNPGDML